MMSGVFVQMSSDGLNFGRSIPSPVGGFKQPVLVDLKTVYRVYGFCRMDFHVIHGIFNGPKPASIDAESQSSIIVGMGQTC